MKHDVFEEPVWMYVRLNFRKEVASVVEAYAFLNDWPPAHKSMHRA